MPSDRTPERPSQRVEAALRARIDENEWKPRERLPPVAKLADEYGVARATVVSALRRMEADGLVVIVSNWGTFRAWTLTVHRRGQDAQRATSDTSCVDVGNADGLVKIRDTKTTAGGLP